MNSWKGLECSKLVQERKISLTWMLSISLISHPSWHLLTITDWMTNVNLWLSCHRHPMVCNASARQSDLRALVYKKKVQPVAGRLYTVLFSLSATTWRGMEAHIYFGWLFIYIFLLTQGQHCLCYSLPSSSRWFASPTWFFGMWNYWKLT